MKTKFLFNASIGLLGLLMIGSCKTSDVATGGLFQKRKYRKGWHSTMTSHNGGVTRGEQQDKSKSIEYEEFEDYLAQSSETDDVSIYIEEPPILNIPQEEKIIPATIAEETPCDLVMLKNGEEINAKVTEIGGLEIKYKLCDNLEGPVYTIPKHEVFKIKYANGSSTLISEIESTNTRPIGNRTSNTNNDPNRPLKIASIAGIIMAAIGFLVSPLLGFLLTGAAFGIGIWTLVRLSGQPKEKRDRRTRNLALWSLILGAIGVFFGIIIFLL